MFTDHNDYGSSIEELDINMPPEGAQKQMKGIVQVPQEFLWLNEWYAPSESLSSSMPQQRYPPQSYDFFPNASQAKSSTTFHDMKEGRGPPKTFPSQGSHQLTSDLLHGDQVEAQSCLNSVEIVNPSQLWNTLNPFGTEAVYSPSHDMQQGADCGGLGLLAEPLYKNETASYQPPPVAMGSASQNESFANDENIFRSEGDGFRFRSILQAPTAMVSDPREAPVSYLNKGHVYQLSVIDSTPPAITSKVINYRTFVRISFEEEKQRSSPAACWQLWKAKEGLIGSRSNDTKLRAIEYRGQDEPNKLIVNAELDGFSITWTIDPNKEKHRCSIPVRFNFLSTDFTLSKGVKGASVRFCVKTEQLGVDAIQKPEACYCNLKLFRDHGAERKLSNDVASIRRRIEKLHRLMSEPVPPEPSSKRKRGSIINSATDFSYSKDNRGMPVRYEDNSRQINYRNKLQKVKDRLQRSIYSSRRESLLSLCAEERDDPEIYTCSPIRSHKMQQRDTLSRRSSTNIDSSSSTSNLWCFNELDTPNAMNNFQSGASARSFKSERETLPAACFYVRLFNGDQPSSEKYRAIYPKIRTVDELVSKILQNAFPSTVYVARILHINKSGLEILVDDDFVKEMPEDQSMVVKIFALTLPSAGSTKASPQIEIRLEY